MKTRAIVTAAVLAVAAAMASDAQAQLFGDRSLGGSVSRRSTPSRPTSRTAATADPSAIGEVSGSERFIRGNRDRNDFVGTDSAEVREFVGAQSDVAAGQTTAAAAAVKVEAVTNANQALKATASRTPTRGLYSPRLSVGFQHPSLASQEVSSNLTQQLSASLAGRLEAMFARNRIPSIEVSLEGGKATLRGTVASEHERTLAGLLALFEPGIAAVENQLEVRRPGAPRQAPPDVPPQASARPAGSDTEPVLKPATP